MKTLYSFVLFIFLSPNVFGQSHKYIPFPDSNAVWTEIVAPDVVDYPYWFEYWKHRLINDTIISGIKYKMIQSYLPFDTLQVSLRDRYISVIYREDTGARKVYVKKLPLHNFNKDTLFYDFNLKVNDTLKKVFFADNRLVIVKDIDSIYLKDGYHRRLIWRDSKCTNCIDGYWIEGIGNEVGFFKAPSWDGFDPKAEVVCFQKNDTITFNNPAKYTNGQRIADCDTLYVSATNNISNIKAEIKFYPNPASINASINLHIFSQNHQCNSTLKIYNVFGNVILTKNLNNSKDNNFTIPIEGIYFAEIYQNGTRIVTQKIIILQ